MKKFIGAILSFIFNTFEGSGLGKIPGIRKIFYYVVSISGEMLYKNVHGQKLYSVILPNKTFMQYYRNDYEPQVTSLFKSIIKKNMAVIDVGANLGYYTLLAAKLVGKNGKVISFEPDPLAFKGLKKNVQMNKCNNVEIFNLAVSDKNEKRAFNSDIDGLGGSAFLYEYNIQTKNNIIVDAISLSSFLHDKPDIVKIDVEGAEVEVIKGLGRLLDEDIKIICEVHPNLLSSMGYKVSEIEEILYKHNFMIYVIKDDGLFFYPEIDKIERKHYLFVKRSEA